MSDVVQSSASVSEAILEDTSSEELVDSVDSTEESDESQDQVEASAEGAKEEAKAPSKEVKKAVDKLDAEKSENKGKYLIKVDGEEVEVNEKELITLAQKGKAFDKRSQELSNMKKDVMNLVELLKTNPKKVLTDPNIGIDVVKFAQEVLAHQLEEEAKSPEQKEIEKLRAALQEKEDQRKFEEEDRKKSEETKKKEEYDQMVASYEEKLQNDFMEAMEGSVIDDKPYVMGRMAEIMKLGFNNGYEVSAKQAMKIIEEEHDQIIKKTINNLPDGAIEKYLTPEFLKRIRKQQVAKLKTPPTTMSSIKASGEAPKKQEKEAPAMSLKELFKL